MNEFPASAGVDDLPPDDGRRSGEALLALPDAADATLFFIGRLRTPWATRDACPKRGDEEGPTCRIELDPPWEPALEGIERHARLQVLYWMHLARRDLVLQVPRSSQHPYGTFALRSPMRPNPIAASVVALLKVEDDGLLVRGLDCVDGTPLIDIKPLRCPMWPTGGSAEHR